MTRFHIRTTTVQVWEVQAEGGRRSVSPLRKVIAAATVSNPYAGTYTEDLSAAVEYSVQLGTTLGQLALDALGTPAQSYGKGGIAGLGGEQEHAVMFLTTAFGDAFRQVLGGGKAWIPSATFVGAAGTPLTVPLAHKDALYVRANYDSVTLYTADGPRDNEVLVAVGLANRGRLNHRLGGLRVEDIEGHDGLH